MLNIFGKPAPTNSPPFLPVSQDGGWGILDSIGTAVAGKAIVFPFWVPTLFKTSKIVCGIGTSSINVDVGIYDKDGNRVVSTGSTVIPATGRRELTIATTTLYPALNPYYWAISSDATSIEVYILDIETLAEFKNFRFLSSFPLPTTLNLAAPSQRGDEQPQFCIVADGLTP